MTPYKFIKKQEKWSGVGSLKALIFAIACGLERGILVCSHCMVGCKDDMFTLGLKCLSHIYSFEFLISK